MTSVSIAPFFVHLKQWAPRRFLSLNGRSELATRPGLRQLARNEARLPRFVRESAAAMRYLRMLEPLAWDQFPERDLQRNYGQSAVPYAPFVAACLIKLDMGLAYMSQLHQYLVEHPPLVWLLGFPLAASSRYPWGFDANACLPTHRHFTRMLRTIPNDKLQFLLDCTVNLLQAELGTVVDDFGQAVSTDTKHIIAWVKENNHKAYVKDRYNKDKQPKGDPDCRLGCKRRRNQRASSKEPPPTPRDNPLPADTISVGEYYWGYASGVVATKVPGWGEFVLAELTQPFDRSDVSYFFPLMADVERRLGFRPRCGAFDAAFDAFYVYEYFHRDGQPDPESAFAAVPFSKRGGHKKTFDQNGLPLCQAGLPMPLKYTFWSKTTLVHHERGRYVCPLLFPEPTAQACPIDHQRWAKGGCTTTMATSIGARIRYQLDRDSEAYKQVYKQRTAIERINSQAVELGIERPKIRNGQAITNHNTLIHVLINLRALHRVRRKRADQRSSVPLSHPPA
jgi:hypothetical protein